MDWPTIWAVLIGGALGIFACVAGVVAIGGFFDIRTMFRRLAHDEKSPPDPDSPA